jgi:hypothetical protein
MIAAGWTLQLAGFALWLFGYLTVGHSRFFDWSAHTPWWIADFLPNAESEIGVALMLVSLVPMYLLRRASPQQN